MSTTSTETTPTTSAVEGINTDGAATAAATQTANSEGKFTQADIDRIVKDRLDKERERIAKTQTDEREKAEREAAEKKALEDGEFQKVIEAKQTELAKLQPQAELATELSTFVNETIDAEIKDWPEDVKTLIPPADDVRARAAEVRRLRPIAAKLSTATPAPGSRRGPAAAAGADPARAREAAKAFVRSLVP